MSDREPGLPLTRIQVRAAQSGDSQALNALLTRYLPWVRQTVALRLGRPLRACTDIEDIVQESLLDAFRAIDDLEDRSDSSFRNWLATIVLNNVRDAGRRARSGRPARARVEPLVETASSTSPGAIVPARDASPTQMALAQELAERIESAMLRLGATHREVLVLRDRYQLEYAEIAKQLGFKNADTVRALHSRALAHLQDQLASADGARGVTRPPS